MIKDIIIIFLCFIVVALCFLIVSGSLCRCGKVQCPSCNNNVLRVIIT